jgi:hypothetical protein
MKTIACFFAGHNFASTRQTEETQNFGPWFVDERTGLAVVATDIDNIINANSPTPGMAVVRFVKTLTVGSERFCSRCGEIFRG